MKRKIALVGLASTVLTGCWTEKYEEVGVHFNRIHRDPDQACTWVQQHASTYDGEFADCGSEILRRLNDAIVEALKYCAEHYSDPDLVRICHDARHVSDMEMQESYLAAVLEITVRGNGCAMLGCDCTIFAAGYQAIVDFFNQTNLELQTGITWEQLMDQSLEDHKKQYACEYKKNVFSDL